MYRLDGNKIIKMKQLKLDNLIFQLEPCLCIDVIKVNEMKSLNDTYLKLSVETFIMKPVTKKNIYYETKERNLESPYKSNLSLFFFFKYKKKTLHIFCLFFL